MLVHNAALALLLAAVLGAAWAYRDWSDLAALRLPDTDDAVRLLQVRDWIGGQSFRDVTQARLGMPPGLAMHWTRVADLGPAALITVFAPVLGAQHAAVAAVTVWPIFLFALALTLIGSIARAIPSAPATAMIIAALAYPATTLFLPGRIDHHGLQIVLLLLLVRGALGGGFGFGALGGVATALSFAVGMETVPLLAVGGLTFTLQWALRLPNGQARLLGYAMALTTGLDAAALIFRTSTWTYPACDGFTETSWRAAQAMALVPLGLAAAGPLLRTPLARTAAMLVAAGVAIVIFATLGRSCADPYGAVDPALLGLWLAHVGEAQSWFAAPAAAAIGYTGLMVVGLVATGWMAVRTRTAAWLVLLAFQLAALAITVAQLRGAYAGAMLAAPALGGMVSAARARGIVALGASWFAASGFVYPLAGAAIAPGTGSATLDCAEPEGLARLAALPAGTVMASIDIGAFAVTATPHRLIAAPYHRNGAGNLAMYRFFLSAPVIAEFAARGQHIDYVAFCPSDFTELGRAVGTATLAGRLRAGHPPEWLVPVGGPGPLRLYRVID